MVLFRHNLPQPTQAQLMRGEFPETLCIEQGVVLSCRFASVIGFTGNNAPESLNSLGDACPVPVSLYQSMLVAELLP